MNFSDEPKNGDYNDVEKDIVSVSEGSPDGVVYTHPGLKWLMSWGVEVRGVYAVSVVSDATNSHSYSHRHLPRTPRTPNEHPLQPDFLHLVISELQYPVVRRRSHERIM